MVPFQGVLAMEAYLFIGSLRRALRLLNEDGHEFSTCKKSSNQKP